MTAEPQPPSAHTFLQAGNAVKYYLKVSLVNLAHSTSKRQINIIALSEPLP